MKTLLIATHVDFWRKGAGHRSRLTSLINYIQSFFNITLVYAGTFDEHDQAIVAKNYPSISFVPLQPKKTITYKEHGELFQSFALGKKFDVALIEYIEMSFVLPMLDESTFTILDTHDLIADRIESFSKVQLPYGGITLTNEEELSIFNCFDRILLIQENDYRKIGNQLGFDRIILVPHAAVLRKNELRNEVKNIGFVASEYPPNAKGINWFLKNVWPLVDNNISLNIYGKVCEQISVPAERVVLHGFVDDLRVAYGHCDFIINPVNCGAGLKIKNVEALSNGLPLITTTHGSIGLDEINNDEKQSFIIADTASEFATAITKLANDLAYRKQLCDNAFLLAQRKFSPAACYQPLVDCMLAYQLTE